jgi:hypothetical protein
MGWVIHRQVGEAAPGPRRDARQAKWIRLLLVLLGSGALCGGALAATPATTLVKVRNFLFTRYIADVSAITDPPRSGLITSTSDDWREVFGTTFRQVPWLLDSLTSIGRAPDPFERARRLALVLSRGEYRSICLTGTPLEYKTNLVLEGYGCCSDYVEVFMALAPWVGLTSREVGFDDHVVVEVYLPERNRWVFVDPLFAVYGADSTGEPVPLVAQWESWRGGSRIAILPLDSSRPSRREMGSLFRTIYLGELPNAISLRVTGGRDVVAAAQAERKYGVVPRPLRLFGLYVTGRLPWYLGFRPGATAASLTALNLAADLAVAVFVLMPVLGLGGIALAGIRLRR